MDNKSLKFFLKCIIISAVYSFSIGLIAGFFLTEGELNWPLIIAFCLITYILEILIMIKTFKRHIKKYELIINKKLIVDFCKPVLYATILILIMSVIDLIVGKAFDNDNWLNNNLLLQVSNVYSIYFIIKYVILAVLPFGINTIIISGIYEFAPWATSFMAILNAMVYLIMLFLTLKFKDDRKDIL